MLTYTYNAIGLRATLNQPTGLFTYAYDAASRISTLTNPESQVTSWLYDAASRVTANLLANGVRVSNTYDNANRLLLLSQSQFERRDAVELQLHLQWCGQPHPSR